MCGLTLTLRTQRNSSSWLIAVDTKSLSLMDELWLGCTWGGGIDSKGNF